MLQVLEAFLGGFEFFFRFSFTLVSVKVDNLEILVEFGEIVRIDVLHRDPVLDGSFPAGFKSRNITLVSVDVFF